MLNESGIKPHAWQEECLAGWEAGGCRGIVNAVTGSGKTFLALAAAGRLAADAAGRPLHVKIVVPQTFLAAQWKEDIKKLTGAKSHEIGFYCGGRKDCKKKYTIYVVNSARYCLSRHIIADIKAGCGVFLIADECHHYASGENSRIFDFVKVIGKNAPYYSLGLSATPETANFDSISGPLGPEIYYYGLKRAIRDGIISKFILFPVMLEFDACEAGEYAELSAALSANLAKLLEARPELHNLPAAKFFARLQALAGQTDETAVHAGAALQLIFKRRTVSHMAAARNPCALAIIKSLPEAAKIILFCERIKAAEALFRSLAAEYPEQAGLYHSEMSDLLRQDALERYRHGELRFLVCCKALDEGLNIPSADAGIIVSSSMSTRQRIQRFGRILRRSDDIKRIYCLYISDSTEEGGCDSAVPQDTVPVQPLIYHAGGFYNDGYDELRTRILSRVWSRREDGVLLDAINEKLSLVLLRGDHLLTEEECRRRLEEKISLDDRNYWVSALYAVLARLGKI